MDNFDNKVLCVGVDVNSVKTTTITTFGMIPFNQNALVIKTKSQKNYEGNWLLPVTGIQVYNKRLDTAPLYAALSTTSSDISIGWMVFSRVIQALGAFRYKESDPYMVLCSRQTELTIYFEDRPVSIPFDAFAESTANKNLCKILITENYSNTEMFIGANLLINNGLCLNRETEEIRIYNSADTALQASDEGVIYTETY
ncbi:unnamed protein product [Bursaphelenchus okinawaensis]|uniref:Peptidase A1 domain-containing protein n=1 Tax=Bursaphelenchus okinawaensis TaxID=465554 RepID=A0A811JZP5_9BILA|nr:unnamed protein product [Bursaphelenchus okinawaensis]CAG9088401.1 unnamed protein product [Bursaphelenchus okinawaensis]